MSDDFMRLVDYRARCFVNRMVWNDKLKKNEPAGASWNHRFEDHPVVRDAEYHSYARDLRGVVIANVKKRILGNQTYDDIDALMPDQKWQDTARSTAQRFAKAKAWRDEIEAEYGSTDQYIKARKDRMHV